jgi:Protein of unknown function (DUF4019)
MRARWLVLLLIFVPKFAASQEIDAQNAAEEIVRMLAAQKYVAVWTDKTSEWGHKYWGKEAFLANMSLGRPNLGALIDLVPISREHTTHDASTESDGDIYAITFRSKYTAGEFYERIVVVKDNDGQYRLSGIYGSKVPQQ